MLHINADHGSRYFCNGKGQACIARTDFEYPGAPEISRAQNSPCFDTAGIDLTRHSGLQSFLRYYQPAATGTASVRGSNAYSLDDSDGRCDIATLSGHLVGLLHPPVVAASDAFSRDWRALISVLSQSPTLVCTMQGRTSPPSRQQRIWERLESKDARVGISYRQA